LFSLTSRFVFFEVVTVELKQLSLAQEGLDALGSRSTWYGFAHGLQSHNHAMFPPEVRSTTLRQFLEAVTLNVGDVNGASVAVHRTCTFFALFCEELDANHIGRH